MKSPWKSLPAHYKAVITALRDNPEFGFEQMIDLCGVDYLSFGESEWDTTDVSSQGFSRGVEGEGPGRFAWQDRPQHIDMAKRFAVVVHLLSVRHNRRIRVRCFAESDDLPQFDSIVGYLPGRRLVRTRSLRPVRHRCSTAIRTCAAS